MNHPAVLVLLLEQGDRSLEDHTEDFVFLTNLTHYLDSCLCLFYQARLNTSTRAQLSRDGPRESLAAFVDTVDIADDDTSPTPDPEPSPPSPRFAERQPEPTADGELEPIATHEPRRSDWAEDFPGARASSTVRPGARAGYIARDGGCYSGAWGCWGKPCPLHRRWGCAVVGLWGLY